MIRFAAALLAASLLASVSFAQVPSRRADLPFNKSWVQPFQAHRVIGPLYYVGTYDLGVFLLTTPDGDILVNTGMEDSAPLIRQNIESLGFRYQDVKVLLTMQAHFDHVAGMATVKKETGAAVWATAEDAKLLESGGATDFLFGPEPSYTPVKVDRILQDGEILDFGGLDLKVILTPGHTPGSSSYALTVEEGGETYNVVLANMNTINAGTKFLHNEKYPNIVQDFEHCFAVQKALDVDIWVSAHASQYGLHDKYSPGDAYNPQRFVDPDGYENAVEQYEERFRQALEAERAGR